MRKVFYIQLFILGTFLLLSTSSFAISLVDTAWLNKNLKPSGIRVVDVQSHLENYSQGHIPGAVAVNRHIDLADITQEPPNLYPTAEQFAKVLQRLGIDNDTTVVAYDDKFGFFASRFLALMEIYGHDTSKLKLLDGGIVKWGEEERPEETASKNVAMSDYKISKLPGNVVITWSDIYRDVLAGMKPNVILLDARPNKEYIGEVIRGIRGGHIPGAINITGSNANDSENHKFKNLNDIRQMYEEQGLSKDSTIYIYCHSGDRAAHSYFQLHHLLGYKNVKLYDGGWNAWNSKLFLPAEGVKWLWEK